MGRREWVDGVGFRGVCGFGLNHFDEKSEALNTIIGFGSGNEVTENVSEIQRKWLEQSERENEEIWRENGAVGVREAIYSASLEHWWDPQ